MYFFEKVKSLLLTIVASSYDAIYDKSWDISTLLLVF